MLASLANLFAYYDADPEVLIRIGAALRDSGQFDAVTEPVDHWVVAWRALPDSRPFGREFDEYQLMFAEGRDQLVRSGPAADKTDEFWRRLVMCVDKTPERLDAFPGDFGFVRLRPNGMATVVRSCAGVVPFYWWKDGSRHAITTQIANILRFTPYEKQLDPLPNAIWAGTGCSVFPDNRTFFRGITIVPRGHFARLTPNGNPAVLSYWDPRPDRLPRYSKHAEAEHAEQLRDILLAKLDSELHPDGGNLLTLSGGVDSSSLVALSTQVLNKRIGTLSIVPAQKDRLAHEMHYIGPLVEHPNVERSWYIYVDENTRLPSFPLPVAFHIPHPCLRRLPEVHQEWPVKVLCGGEWADELTGSLLTLPDWSRHTSFPRLMLSAARGRTPLGGKTLLRWVRYRLLQLMKIPYLPFAHDLPAIFADELSDEYKEWRSEVTRRLHHDRRPWRFLDVQTRQPDGHLAMNWEACAPLGIRRSLPFVNREAFELAFACHPRELVGPDTKKLQRLALDRLVPRRNLYRRNKSGWARHLRHRKKTVPTNHQPSPEVSELLRPDYKRILAESDGPSGELAMAFLLGFWHTIGLETFGAGSLELDIARRN